MLTCVTLQFTGDSRSTLEPQYVVYRGGFETRLVLPRDSPTFARVAALDRNGKLLGSTDLIDTKSGERVKMGEEDKPLEIDFSLDSDTLR